MKTRQKQQGTQRQTAAKKTGQSSKGLTSLRELLVEELQDLYNAENQLVKALPKVAASASTPELKEAIEGHLEETKGHVQRLEQVFEELGEKAKGEHCDAMEGLLEEGKKMMEKEGREAVVDAGIIAACQRVEHYEIAGYGCVIAFARRLGLNEPAELLEQTLEEEKKADEKLTEITETSLELDDEAEDNESEDSDDSK